MHRVHANADPYTDANAYPLTLQVIDTLPGAAYLTLTGVVVIDLAGNGYSVNEVRNAQITVGGTCAVP